ncbi:MAG: pyruvate kinase [Candidatus Omnitrophica bacterium CG08_land_8_20_14_0_20_41_16]|uniref:Pyruvate kinase n=1 Tax=Candidatus Sherwoodlollariibacterium unditelluris TaxID=1974757 RepID=A0A2G9YK82_9BACT|nr:MAG: pyruvate kinase [Candidatus Omnitrophica bacterium CG23_combo_of_CG06-09_8_20_14_all_41_10]PIS33293.1 MAG: pyruvate kinase [Candidatus Omnitrophica bacterium CG08_land_8_20_14_0_20_41_16]
MPKTKIICTLGPASSREHVLLKMMGAGMGVARLNFSHSTLKVHLARIRLIRKLNKKYHLNVKVLGDLEGYRIRVGRLKKGQAIKVNKGQVVWLTQENILGEGSLIPFDYKDSLYKIKKGHHIYIDDGNIALIALAREKNRLKAKVVVPGIIKERKGINMPDIKLNFKGLMTKDIESINFCIENKIDYIAQSFVRSKDDILIIREYLKNYPHKYQIIAKIENREGIKNIDEIIKVCDGIMVARGDMGVSIPVYEVPIVQKEIIRKCNRANKFVITATQMLESMTENRIPERAEVSDVANAILDGSDYVMLSAETAVGLYPVDCVDMMNKIIKFTEKSISNNVHFKRVDKK